MGDGNSFPLVVCVFQVILAYESIVLCMCSGKYIDIYFMMKITFQPLSGLRYPDLLRLQLHAWRLSRDSLVQRVSPPV